MTRHRSYLRVIIVLTPTGHRVCFFLSSSKHRPNILRTSSELYANVRNKLGDVRSLKRVWCVIHPILSLSSWDSSWKILILRMPFGVGKALKSLTKEVNNAYGLSEPNDREIQSLMLQLFSSAWANDRAKVRALLAPSEEFVSTYEENLLWCSWMESWNA